MSKCRTTREIAKQILSKTYSGDMLENMVDQYMKISGANVEQFMATNSAKLQRSGKDMLAYDVIGKRARMGLITPIKWVENDNGLELTYKTNIKEEIKTTQIDKNGVAGNMWFRDVEQYFKNKNANTYTDIVNAVRNSDKNGIEDKMTNEESNGSEYVHEKITNGEFNELLDTVVKLDNETDEEYLSHVNKVSEIISDTVDANKVVLEVWDKEYSRGQYNKINDKIRVKVTNSKIADSETTNTEALIHENGHAVIELVEYSNLAEKQALINEKWEIHKYLEDHLKPEDFVLGEKTELSMEVAKRKYEHMMSDPNELLPHMISNKAMFKWMQKQDRVEFRFKGTGLTTKVLNWFEQMYYKLYDIAKGQKNVKLDKQVVDLLARYAALNKRLGSKIVHKPNMLAQVNRKIRKKVFEKISAKYDKLKLKAKYSGKFNKVMWLIDSDIAKFTFEGIASMYSSMPIISDISNDIAMLYSEVANKRSSWYGKFEMLNLKSRQIDEEVQSIQKDTENEVNKLIKDIDKDNVEQTYEMIMYNDILELNIGDLKNKDKTITELETKLSKNEISIAKKYANYMKTGDVDLTLNMVSANDMMTANKDMSKLATLYSIDNSMVDLGLKILRHEGTDILREYHNKYKEEVGVKGYAQYEWSGIKKATLSDNMKLKESDELINIPYVKKAFRLGKWVTSNDFSFKKKYGHKDFMYIPGNIPVYNRDMELIDMEIPTKRAGVMKVAKFDRSLGSVYGKHARMRFDVDTSKLFNSELVDEIISIQTDLRKRAAKAGKEIDPFKTKLNLVSVLDKHDKPTVMVRLSEKNPNLLVQEFFKVLPLETKRMIQDKKIATKNGDLFIPQDALLNIIGHREISIANLIKEKGPISKKIRKWIRLIEKTWQDISSLEKVTVLIKNPEVFIGNIVSNYAEGYQLDIPPSHIHKMTMAATSGSIRYMEYQEKITKLLSKQANKGLIDKEKKQLAVLKDYKKKNVMSVLSDYGQYIAAIEEFDSQENNNNIIEKELKKFKGKFPEMIQEGLDVFWMTDKSDYHQKVSMMIQMGDLVFKLAVIKYLHEVKGMTKEKAIEVGIQSTINYENADGRILHYANKMFLKFTKFPLRIMKVVGRGIFRNPLNFAGVELADSFIYDFEDITDTNLFSKNRATNPLEDIQTIISSNIAKELL